MQYNSDEQETIDAEEGAEIEESVDWVDLARVAFEESEMFIERSHRDRWMRNYSMAQSEHPLGSKYLTKEFEHRSKEFRGKTESALRTNEAALAVALFTNRDAVSVTAENENDEGAVNAAEAIKELVNYRLAKKETKWFRTVIGAYHEAQINGNVVSEQYWDYRKTDDGEVLKDRPRIILHPLENVHISPGSDWSDPINTSPYLIIDTPMFVGDIKERMEDDWEKYDDSIILTAVETGITKEVKRSRIGETQTIPEDEPSSITDFDLAAVHKVFMKVGEDDWFYFTLGTTHMLSEPVLVEEAYPHAAGFRPLAWGGVAVEPHKIYNRSTVDRVFGTQVQINELANQRFDNVRQVLNKRKYALRNAGVDYATLLKNVPGSVVRMDTLGAVVDEQTSDITGSSYNEQNLLNADFDDLAGAFSNSSVDTNRNFNETVGGMQLLKGKSDSLSEFQMRTFIETWVEEVVTQFAIMCQKYEDDETIQLIASVNSEDIQTDINVKVDVGFGATDPKGKVNNLLMGISTVSQMFPNITSKLKEEEIVAEVFGALGYGDGGKFVDKEEDKDPEKQQMGQMIQKLQLALQQLQNDQKTKIELEKIKINGSLQKQQMADQSDMNQMSMKLQSDRQIAFTQMAVKQNITVKELESKAGVNNEKMTLEILKEANRRQDIDNQKKELNYKMTTGNDGI